jgi:hypothetical protein
MRFFKFYSNGERAVSLVPVDLDYFQEHFTGRRMVSSWKPPAFDVLRRAKPIRDFVSWSGSVIVVTARAKDRLERLIGPYVEFLPLATLKGKELFAVNVVEVVDCLDRKASKITPSRDDPSRIVHIGRFVFDRTRLRNVPVFKIPEWPASIFVSEEFARAVVSGRLTGAGFDDPEDIRYVKEPWDGTFMGLPNAREYHAEKL